MIGKFLGVLSIAVLLGGCEVVVARPHRGMMVAQPGPGPAVVEPGPGPVAETPPNYVEEGTTIGGTVVVAPPGPLDYVFINGGWFYWQPGLHVWVHAHRPAGWRPAGGHVYNHWTEHPAYRHR